MLVYKVTDFKVLQHNSRSKYLVPNGSQNTILAVFVFDEKEWEPFTSRFAQFTKAMESYNVMLGKNNECYLPAQLNPGEWQVSVFGINPNEPGKRMTTINSSLYVVPTYNPHGVAPAVAPDDIYARMFLQIKEMATGVSEDSEAVEEARKQVMEAKEYVAEVADGIQGDIDSMTDEVLKQIRDEVYKKEEVYNKEEINGKEEAVIVLSSSDIDAILGD